MAWRPHWLEDLRSDESGDGGSHHKLGDPPGFGTDQPNQHAHRRYPWLGLLPDDLPLRGLRQTPRRPAATARILPAGSAQAAGKVPPRSVAWSTVRPSPPASRGGLRGRMGLSHTGWLSFGPSVEQPCRSEESRVG